MRRVGWLAVRLIVAAIAAGCIPAASGAASSGPASCALGKLSAHDALVERAVLSHARAGFQRSLSGVSRAARDAAGGKFVTDLAAYLYGYPIVILRRTLLTFPRNEMVSIATLAGPSIRTIVAPNHDTLYSVGQIDLSAGPIVIQTPPTEGRYSVIQLTDSFTDVAAYLGDGAAARTGETAAIVPPGWHGQLPAGVRVVRPATKLVWLLGRTLAAGKADTAAAVRLLARYSVTPLTDYLAGHRITPLILPGFPAHKPVTVPPGTAFYDALGGDLSTDPPPARDACALGIFARAGIGAGMTPTRRLEGLSSRALIAAAADGRRVLATLVETLRHASSQVINGWASMPPDAARFGTDYLHRVYVAAIGLGANTDAKALYLTEDRDSKGRPLNGAHVYMLRFRPGQLPPVSAFWSLTLYDRQILLYANPLSRYAIGDRTGGLRHGRDGGLTIIVSHREPDVTHRSNWLPAPAGSFSLYLRLYEPKAPAIDRKWLPPSVDDVVSPLVGAGGRRSA
jgi:hypothetical protein